MRLNDCHWPDPSSQTFQILPVFFLLKLGDFIANRRESDIRTFYPINEKKYERGRGEEIISLGSQSVKHDYHDV
jgi:hypothetical protein